MVGRWACGAMLAVTACTLPCTAQDSDQWTMVAHDYANTRYAPLSDIDARNAAQLKLVFSFSTGVVRGHEAAPLVVGDTMYLVTPFPNYLYALDLRQPQRPQKWRFDPHVHEGSQGKACCDVVNRGPAFADGLIERKDVYSDSISILRQLELGP